MQESLLPISQQVLSLVDADVSYYPDFLADHQQYLSVLAKELAWQQDEIKMFGKLVRIPRLSAWYGDKEAYYSYSGLSLAPKPWVPALQDLKQKIEILLHHSFNSVLANYYRNGQDSMGWHSDDERELGSQPVIASLNLGATRRFSFRHRTNKQLPTTHIQLEGGSLLVMQGDTQRYWHHQVAKTAKPVGERINLTFRTIVSG